ncbi:MAG: BamA/TamA family outer membrane protein, partial [FCB group bacterium]
YYDTRDVYTFTDKGGLPRNQFERLQTGELNETKYGENFSLGTEIEKNGKLAITIRNEKQRYYDLKDSILPDYYSIQSLKIGTIFDNEDRADFPTSGRVLDMSLEIPLPFYSTTDAIGFSKAKLYFRSNSTIGISTIRVSGLFGFADRTLPLPEFFEMGGQESFFGMREDEERGEQIVLGSIEYRIHPDIKFFFSTYFSIRYDLGAVWLQTEDIKFSKFKHGIGGTISFDTPVGPAKFSLGRAFYFVKDPSGITWSPFAIYFSIGMKL